MAYYKDLSSCDYFEMVYKGPLTAIGWLEPEHDYARREVDLDFFTKLCQLLQCPWNPDTFLGFQGCGFCRFSGGAETLLRLPCGTYRIPGWSRLNLFIPGDGVVYVSPEMIAHYIDAHEYKPPQQFVDAVMDCPPMKSPEYHLALQASGWDPSKDIRNMPQPEVKLWPYVPIHISSPWARRRRRK